jgi:hypothetical protein
MAADKFDFTPFIPAEFATYEYMGAMAQALIQKAYDPMNPNRSEEAAETLMKLLDSVPYNDEGRYDPRLRDYLG